MSNETVTFTQTITPNDGSRPLVIETVYTGWRASARNIAHDGAKFIGAWALIAAALSKLGAPIDVAASILWTALLYVGWNISWRLWALRK